MKLREAFAWSLCLFWVLAFWLVRVALFSAQYDLSSRAVEIADHAMEVGSLRYACGERANMIFECTEQICEVNGWHAPADWYDRQDED